MNNYFKLLHLFRFVIKGMSMLSIFETVELLIQLIVELIMFKVGQIKSRSGKKSVKNTMEESQS
jgi:hypothetical protein